MGKKGNNVCKSTYMALIFIRILFPQWRESLRLYEKKTNQNCEGLQFKLEYSPSSVAG